MLIHKNTINALKVATSTDEHRYGLGGIHFEDDGTAVATDGHMLLYAKKPASIPVEDFPTTPNSTTEPIDASQGVGGNTVPVGALVNAAKHIKGKQYAGCHDHVAVVPNSHGVRVLAIDGKASSISDQHVEPIQAAFPEWQKVVPQGEATVTVCISARILADLAKAAYAVSPSRDTACVKFELARKVEKGKPYASGVRVTLRSDVEDNIGGVVMPMVW